ncbi:bifunctional 2-polyprenyl-6-hydroxyphenol methylase/3-demethylubiquinol 3-O-methyltransferase UbiG [Comamonas sp. NLF-1-9]|uniref:bifunctional 2-polyprenyl-6-hydroxyphenol methylase/3-demethylubiquinol 3-O-methyltransferase UbiG n=1 Tax=Comamonas sp. NLF-1-9 TaxID=2853163 RepID=UPI001C44C03D|nr:bifunctional 2-polyprenyl-6-hydroxyphenol methylase/3-demethylubiquinol 3-O-methyltransferase UbiG [Comamonas sp. NLF-1-9]QXL84972.1 bifunctional 2-polyprenyl-6-hydroxyphenol methylase/3-demethylubiquinol 3-O-methyltransferase UbiG [Comamonas sp. NLF-1-9]
MTTNQPSNVDRQEVDKFDRIAQLWWDPKGKMGMLHVINPLRSRFTFEHVDVRGKRVVDVGCGGGILTETLAKAGADVVGLDQSELTLQVARQHAARAGLSIDYRLQTVETLAQQEPCSYDVVTCLEMLEHVPDPAAIVQACARLLKPGGHAIFSTINRNFKAWLFAIVGGEYILRILPRGTHDYAKLIRPQELRNWAGQAGLKHLRSASLMYHPLSGRFRVAPGKEDVNYMMSCIKLA